MSFINTIQVGARNVSKTLAKESPTILTGLAVTGLISTVVLAVKATPKAIYLLDNERALREQNSEDGCPPPLTVVDKVKVTWKCYIPTALVGTATVACIIGANSINLRRNAALASIYSLTEATLKEYQEKVIETIGKNKEEKIHSEIAQDRLNEHPVDLKTIILTNKGDTLCYDSLSARYFKSDMETIRKIQNDFNNDLISEAYKTVNELYDALGLEHTSLGENMGWSTDFGLLDIRFDAKIATNGEPCIVLDYKIGPRNL